MYRQNGVRLPAAEVVFVLPLQRLAEQQLRGGENALCHQQQAEVVHGFDRVRMPTAQRSAPPL